MNNMIDTGFGFGFKIDKKNNNLELENKLSKSTTIFTPRGTEVTL